MEASQYSQTIGEPDSQYRPHKFGKGFEKDDELESIAKTKPKPIKLENIQKVLVPGGRRNQDALMEYSQS